MYISRSRARVDRHVGQQAVAFADAMLVPAVHSQSGHPCGWRGDSGSKTATTERPHLLARGWPACGATLHMRTWAVFGVLTLLDVGASGGWMSGRPGEGAWDGCLLSARRGYLRISRASNLVTGPMAMPHGVAPHSRRQTRWRRRSHNARGTETGDGRSGDR
ncbi:hypothetical protein P171DRAFT_64015 [Karstenula rhodostoma CBS 690.94]|uniref:Uncharacterized protein n=1 Tax=Karstenula rhodostoma CBS 690.94 TaxID=1392251 RepID=A0A9P4PFU1_9PLEO|nr:hypothetical protein P171DRAFT_64015 [Karstenula rhodostoma CBS 690.94]